MSGFNISSAFLGTFMISILGVLNSPQAAAQNALPNSDLGGDSGIREVLGRGLSNKLSVVTHGHLDLTFNRISGSGAGANSFRVIDPPGPAPSALRFDPTLSGKLDGSARNDGVNRRNVRFGKHVTPQALLRLRAGVKRAGWAVGAAGRFEFNADQEFDQELRDSAESLQRVDDLVTQGVLFVEKAGSFQFSVGIQEPKPLFYSLVTSGEAGYQDFPEPVPATRIVADLSKNLVVTLGQEWQRRSMVIAPAYRTRFGNGLLVLRGRIRKADNDPAPTFRNVERRVATLIYAGAMLYRDARWRVSANAFQRLGRRGTELDIVQGGAGLAYRVKKPFEISLEAGRRDVRKSGFNTFNGAGGPPPLIITSVADANVWLDFQQARKDWIGIGLDYDISERVELTGGVKWERHDFSDPTFADRKRTIVTTALRYKF